MGKRKILGLDLGSNSIGWALVEWKEVLSIVNGKNQKAVENPDGLYPIYGSGGVMSYADEYLCPENTTIVGRKGTINKPILVREKFWNVDTAFGLVAGDKLDSFYLNYFCQLFDFFTLNKSTTLPSLAKRDLKEIKIPLPPLPEQQRIVAKLDVLFAAIDEAIGLLEENITHTQALMGSVLDEEFGKLEKLSSKKEKLINITIKIGSGSTPRGGQKYYKASGISLIRSMNVHDCFFKEKNLAFIDDVQADKLKNVEIQENDVLLNITGASVARCCIVDSSYLPARVNQHVSIIRTDESILPEFMLYFLVSPKMKSKLLYDSAGNATREAITKSMIQSIEVPIVSKEIQQGLVDKIKESFNLCERVAKIESENLNHLKSLKSSLLDQAFRGEL